MLGLRTVRSCYTSLGAAHRLVVEGVKPGSTVLADGNPVSLLDEADRVEVAVRPRALHAVTMSRSWPKAWPAGLPERGGGAR